MLSKKRILQLTLVSVGSIYLFSCGNAANLPSASSVSPGAGCPAGIGGMDASCCDTTGAVIAPPTSTACGLLVPGVGGVTNPINGGASAGNSVGQTTGAAANLVGGQGIGNGLANESAATAGGISPSVAGLGANIPLQTSGLGVTTSGNAGGSGNEGPGSGDGSGSVATAPAGAPSSTVDPNALANGASAATSAQYAGGGAGGGLLPNGAHATGFQFGNGFANGDGSGAAGSAEIAFGAQRNPAAMAGEDPSDYFTRIGLDDSLFKKVEKRYRSTSANWETASLAPQAQVLVKTPK
jgi:hypothetical protein